MVNAPVFILGLHRSGTTLLYQMLGRSDSFNIVTARHVLCFEQLRDGALDGPRSRRRLQRWFQAHNLRDRAVDVVPLSPDTPEEYGFILARLGAGYALTRRNLHLFRHVCETVQRDYANGRRLLLKNPWDFGHGDRIHRWFPDATIVYIHRNPLHVLSSSLRTIAKAMEAPHPYLAALSEEYRWLTRSGFPWRTLQRLARDDSAIFAQFVIRNVARTADEFLGSIRRIPLESRTEVSYEQLCQRPSETITRLLDRLGARGHDLDYAGMIGPRHASVHPTIARHRALVMRKFGRYAAATGYDLTVPARAKRSPCH